MIFSLQVMEIIGLSIQVSTIAVLFGMLVGIPCGAFLGLYSFPGKRFIVILLFTLMGLPPVLIGVIVYMALSKYGLLGFFQLLFTPEAMIIAQTILVTPIITGLTMSAVQARERTYYETAKSLGATPLQLVWTILKEARGGIWSGISTAYGRAISEVGAVMLVGGNIEHETRVMTTAIILETRKGNFDIALQIGAVLLLISFIFNSFLVAGALQNLNDGRRKT
ncbi:ABC transporter permease [Paenibacillus validus]|uniref:ABC transporter permease n=1 Tax=Paenibacillus TaxID=44249 RepID=UPI000FD80020|nr:MULTISPECIES: ABC transporter permease [Paenibacillus]MED4599334.1 ABC transporter permease [Paenibacillus validus]MED4606354.1 ABC transporter permease [Paenibacillus validus]